MVGTSAELGAVVHEARVAAGLTQAEAARRAAVSRKWLIELEQGHSNAQLGKVLHTLRSLGLTIEIAPAPVVVRNELDDLTESFLR
jgi:transcriptional regulator with XRE-family HTH domain